MTVAKLEIPVEEKTMSDDIIYRQAAIDAVRHSPIIEVQPAYMLIDKADVLKNLVMLPPAQPEITLESAIDFLHKIGWLQEHDRIMSEQKKGKWILINGAAGVYECNQCHERVCCVGKYCMGCGAQMEVEK